MSNSASGCHTGSSRRNRWKPKEDAGLVALVTRFLQAAENTDDDKVLGVDEWKAVSDAIPGRSSKQCRERWRNHLDPRLTTEKWTQEEDELIQQLRTALGNSWKQIAAHLPGRSETAIKNRHYSNLRRVQRSKRGADGVRRVSPRSLLGTRSRRRSRLYDSSSEEEDDDSEAEGASSDDEDAARADSEVQAPSQPPHSSPPPEQPVLHRYSVHAPAAGRGMPVVSQPPTVGAQHIAASAPAPRLPLHNPCGSASSLPHDPMTSCPMCFQSWPYGHPYTMPYPPPFPGGMWALPPAALPLDAIQAWEPTPGTAGGYCKAQPATQAATAGLLALSTAGSTRPIPTAPAPAPAPLHQSTPYYASGGMSVASGGALPFTGPGKPLLDVSVGPNGRLNWHWGLETHYPTASSPSGQNQYWKAALGETAVPASQAGVPQHSHRDDASLASTLPPYAYFPAAAAAHGASMLSIKRPSIISGRDYNAHAGDAMKRQRVTEIAPPSAPTYLMAQPRPIQGSWQLASNGTLQFTPSASSSSGSSSALPVSQ